MSDATTADPAASSGAVQPEEGGAGTALATIPFPSVSTTFLVLAAIAFFFFIATVAITAVDEPSTFLARFDTGNEANAPTWYSSLLWTGAGGLALAIGAAGRRLSDAQAPRWTLIGIGCLLLSLDETGQLHEESVHPLMTAATDVTGLSHTVAKAISVGVIGLALLAIFIWFLPWLRSLSSWLRMRLIASGVVFVSGSLGLEVISRLSSGEGVWRYLSPIEEFCEMLGVSLLIVTLLPALEAVRARARPG